MARGMILARAARDLVGTPFRLHGRDPAVGLDCVGLLGAALAAAGHRAALPTGYRLRQRDIGPWLALAGAHGFEEAGGAIWPGDVLLVRPGPVQHHLLIAGPAGEFLHAHAGLGRVVATPPPAPWPAAHHWRLRAG